MDRDGEQTQRLRIAYELPANVDADLLRAQVAEAFRRHRARPGDVSVSVDGPADAAGPSVLVIEARIPQSAEGRARDSLLRDLETILDGLAPGRWTRVRSEVIGDGG